MHLPESKLDPHCFVSREEIKSNEEDNKFFEGGRLSGDEMDGERGVIMVTFARTKLMKNTRTDRYGLRYEQGRERNDALYKRPCPLICPSVGPGTLSQNR